MTNPKDGGPASAMTLRDYFAAMALQGFVNCDESRRGWTVQRECEKSYEYANAMIKERERHDPPTS